MVVRLLFDFRTPVPSGRQSTVDARTGVKEIICTRAVKRVPKKVRQNQLTTALHAVKGVLDVLAQLAVFARQFRQLFYYEDDRRLGIRLARRDGWDGIGGNLYRRRDVHQSEDGAKGAGEAPRGVFDDERAACAAKN